jgi:2-haloacid dehalogenase
VSASRLAGVKALGFDVFGTVVDWRASIIREGQALGRTRGLEVDWEAFTDAWRASTSPRWRRCAAARCRGRTSTISTA